jgi:hypothetical protein
MEDRVAAELDLTALSTIVDCQIAPTRKAWTELCGSGMMAPSKGTLMDAMLAAYIVTSARWRSTGASALRRTFTGSPDRRSRASRWVVAPGG